MDTCIVFTDGAAKGNPGFGGWAALVNGELHSGPCRGIVTNNTAELFAIYQALSRCPDNSEVTIFTDSKIAQGLLVLGWETKHQHLRDLCACIALLAQVKGLVFTVHVVKGHAGHRENSIVDRAASDEAKAARSAAG